MIKTMVACVVQWTLFSVIAPAEAESVVVLVKALWNSGWQGIVWAFGLKPLQMTGVAFFLLAVFVAATMPRRVR